jgi:hypothetical protein
MSGQYYLMVASNRIGPLTFEQMEGQTFSARTPVWHAGLAEWTYADQVPELASVIANRSALGQNTILSNPPFRLAAAATAAPIDSTFAVATEGSIQPAQVGPPPLMTRDATNLQKMAATRTNCEQLFWGFMITLALYVAGAFLPSLRMLLWNLASIFAFAIEVCAVVYVIGRRRWFWQQPRGVQVRGMVGAIGGLVLLLFAIVSIAAGIAG